MKKKILSVLLILLMATVSISFPVFADDEPEPVIEPVEPEELPLPVEIEEEIVGDAVVSETLEPVVAEGKTEENIEENIEEPVVTAIRSVPLLGSSGTDAWLADWDYEIKPLYYNGDYIYLRVARM